MSDHTHQILRYLLFLTLALPLAAVAESTITYQGKLQQDGEPFTGTPGMAFRLYDSPTGDNQIGDVEFFTAVPVEDGLFQVELDFGDVYDGDRWLEIEVVGEILGPRQRLTSAPTAVRAQNVPEQIVTGLAGGDGIAPDTIGDGDTLSLDISFTDGLYWRQGGNAGIDPASDFLGTSDEVPFEIHVDSQRALRFEPADIPNIIGGWTGNSVATNVIGATIGGGGCPDLDTFFCDSEQPNMVTDDFGTIGGGFDNTTSNRGAKIGGGRSNTASGESSTVPGGHNNEASGDWSFAAGFESEAIGRHSFAFGTNASAPLRGQVVFTDSNEGQPSTNTNDRFIGNFDNGYRLETDADSTAGVFLQNGDSAWSSLSAREYKTNFEPVDAAAILDAVMNLEVSRWTYEWQTDINRMGPTAGEFYEAFGVGRNDDAIQTMDAIGVLYAAVQGLAERNSELESQINRVAQLEIENAELKERLARLESVLLDERQVAGGQQ